MTTSEPSDYKVLYLLTKLSPLYIFSFLPFDERNLKNEVKAVAMFVAFYATLGVESKSIEEPSEEQTGKIIKHIFNQATMAEDQEFI